LNLVFALSFSEHVPDLCTCLCESLGQRIIEIDARLSVLQIVTFMDAVRGQHYRLCCWVNPNAIAMLEDLYSGSELTVTETELSRQCFVFWPGHGVPTVRHLEEYVLKEVTRITVLIRR
jgi:hypothetical protein